MNGLARDMQSRIPSVTPSSVARGAPKDRPTRAEAERAVETLIRWAGDDPSREGLLETPARVVRAYQQWFAGYHQDPAEHLRRTFEEVAGYDEMVVMRDIDFQSHCEHHMAPISGRVHSATCHATRWSAFPSWCAWCRCSRADCRRRKR